jgi:hypothetical protein
MPTIGTGKKLVRKDRPKSAGMAGGPRWGSVRLGADGRFRGAKTRQNAPEQGSVWPHRWSRGEACGETGYVRAVKAMCIIRGLEHKGPAGERTTYRRSQWAGRQIFAPQHLSGKRSRCKDGWLGVTWLEKGPEPECAVTKRNAPEQSETRVRFGGNAPFRRNGMVLDLSGGYGGKGVAEARKLSFGERKFKPC